MFVLINIEWRNSGIFALYNSTLCTAGCRVSSLFYLYKVKNLHQPLFNHCSTSLRQTALNQRGWMRCWGLNQAFSLRSRRLRLKHVWFQSKVFLLFLPNPSPFLLDSALHSSPQLRPAAAPPSQPQPPFSPQIFLLRLTAVPVPSCLRHHLGSPVYNRTEAFLITFTNDFLTSVR